jgi:molybdopterin synthase catalytic subunit/molybdopterin converting factor small subunit
MMGKSADSAELPEHADISSLLEHYARVEPKLNGLLGSLAVSVNQEYANRSASLRDGDEVALLPPVSGGTDDARRGRYSEIVRNKIDAGGLIQAMKAPADGAVVVFEGIVRDNTRGRRTMYLDYHAYEEMAVKQMDALVEQALRDYKVDQARIIHRLGRMEIGETSVWIGVSSPHRGAAYEASRFLIDTLKKTVPIWKKEYFEDGAVWADGEPFPEKLVNG